MYFLIRFNTNVLRITVSLLCFAASSLSKSNYFYCQQKQSIVKPVLFYKSFVFLIKLIKANVLKRNQLNY